MVQVLIRQPPVYSMPGIPGLRTINGNRPGYTLYGSRKKRTAPPLSAEQQSKFDASMDAACAALESGNAEEFFASIRNGERALNREKDREARMAVEGNTDDNHDNTEAAE